MTRAGVWTQMQERKKNTQYKYKSIRTRDLIQEKTKFIHRGSPKLGKQIRQGSGNQKQGLQAGLTQEAVVE